MRNPAESRTLKLPHGVWLSARSHAKVNLFSSIAGPKIKGRWQVFSVVLPIQLHDVVSVRLIDDAGIYIECNSPNVPVDENNICHRAARIMLTRAKWFKGGVAIRIKKRIPVSSGLGGGSSNATSVLEMLNVLLGLELNIVQISEIALSLSNDSYVLCFNKPSLVLGSFNNLIPLPLIDSKFDITIVDTGIPYIENKSALVFSRIQKVAEQAHEYRPLLNAWGSGDISLLQKNTHSFITRDIIPEYKKAFRIQELVSNKTGLKLTFTGTGPFLVIPTKNEQHQAIYESTRDLGIEVTRFPPLSCFPEADYEVA